MTLLAEIALIAAAAVVVAVCLALLPRAPAASGRRREVRHTSRPEQLTRLESRVITAGTTTISTHAYLRPVLVEIASQRLAARGLALDRMPEAEGQALLGSALWDLVRPGRPFPEDRHAPGVSPKDLKAMVEVLERL